MKTTIIITQDEGGTVRSIIQGAANENGKDFGDALCTVAMRDPLILGACLYSVGCLLKENDPKGFENFMKSVAILNPKLHVNNLAKLHARQLRKTA